MKKFKPYIFLHFTVLIGSFNGIFLKLAATKRLLSAEFFLYYGSALFGAGIYAILWQQNIKKLPLNIAYANKAVSLIWTALWGTIFFGENITLLNILGTVVVLIGVLLMVASGEKNE